MEPYEQSMKRLFAVTAATRDVFPWPPGHVRKRGDTDDVAPLFDHYGLFFEEEREGRTFTSLHTFLGRSNEERACSLEAIAASAQTAGLCYNPVCPLRPSGTFKALSLCSRCRMVGYCGTACQREHWPAHKALCKRAAGVAGGSDAVAASPGASIAVDDGAAAFSRAATAAVMGASGPIAMLSWIWRSKAGYNGDAGTSGRLPPVVLVELLDEDCASGWKAPTPMRISELTDPLGSNPSASAWLTEAQFPAFFVRVLVDATKGGMSDQVRSGARVWCIVTTPARNPRRTKLLTLVHAVPLPLLARKLQRIQREADGAGADSMMATPVLQAKSIVARPITAAEGDALSMGVAGSHTEAKAARAFCNLQYATDFDPSTALAPVHALLISDCELVQMGADEDSGKGRRGGRRGRR
jgi:hypothetical protein